MVEIVWAGVGSDAISTTRASRRGRNAGIAERRRRRTLPGTTGSLPLDPAATLTTIGTGGLPFQHGITGDLIRDKRWRAVRARGATSAPTSIIATLPDDRRSRIRRRSGLGSDWSRRIRPTEGSSAARGTWITIATTSCSAGTIPCAPSAGCSGRGYGVDGTTDILGVVLDRVGRGCARRDAIVAAVRSAVPDATFVVTASGRTTRADGSGAAVGRTVDRTIGSPVVAAVVPGGLFLDQAVMAANDITSDDVVRAMDAMTAPDGTPLFADAYPGFAISFSRYC